MSKYQELVDYENKRLNNEDALKTKANRDFTKKFSKYLECNNDNISISFKECKHLTRNKMSTLDFTLNLKLNQDSISLSGFSISEIEGSDVQTPARISYKGEIYNLADKSEELFAIVFSDIKNR